MLTRFQAALVLLASVALPTSAAHAQDYLAVSGLSYHYDRSKSLNEQHPGLSAGWQSGRCGREVGAYYNSYSEVTLYGLGFCETGDQHKFGAFLGLASGYADDPSAVGDFLGLVGLQYRNGPIQLRLAPPVAFLQLRFDLK